MTYTTITTEGGLLPADILDAIAAEEAAGQQAADFGLERGIRLSDEIAAAWGDARAFWDAFQRRLHRQRPSDSPTSITRESWIIPLLEILGYRDIIYMRSAAEIEGRTYAISHRAGRDDDALPLHIEGVQTDLDARPPTGRPRLSPHALLQEYLNSTEHLWSIVTNGERVRLLRDSSRMTRPTYVEFNLRAMLEGEQFSEFALLYRLLHRSRFPADPADAPTCWLERYYQQAIEQGGRVREGLRDGVEAALKRLGTGFLQHPRNQAVREKIAAGTLTPLDYYRQLLRLVYRLLFLMVAEERHLIAAAPDEDDLLSPLAYRPQQNERLDIYRAYYSVGRLRRMAEHRGAGRGPYDDLWLGLQTTFRLLEGDDEPAAQALGLAPLDGDLFGPTALRDLEPLRLRNADLLGAIRALSLYREQESTFLRRVNYGALDVEELGSVYESLLDYRPVIMKNGKGEMKNEAAKGFVSLSAFHFELVAGTERKTTGSYYTRPELVQELITSALDPVIDEKLKMAKEKGREEALLSIRVCDPACGSGHFLLAAARRIGRALAQVRSGEDQPTPPQFRRAVRDVIARCIYGVDLNPLAVDLCKLALWIEGHNAGMPLSFLDSHIRLGNSLVGASGELVDAGIPDDAFKPVTGDDKKIAAAQRKRNKQERELYEKQQMAQEDMFAAPAADPAADLAAGLRALDQTPDSDVATIHEKARRYADLRQQARAQFVLYDLWTAAFFQALTPDQSYITTRLLLDHQRAPLPFDHPAVLAAHMLANEPELQFFHWELEFPQVFAMKKEKGEMKKEDAPASFFPFHSSFFTGFDVVLGNPPWERIKLQEQEHFVDVPEIRNARNKAERDRLIRAWRGSDDPAQRERIAEFDRAKHRAEASSRFVRASGRYPLTAVGDVNTYALFAELDRGLLNASGRVGMITPTGIVTDDTTKTFFGDLVLTKTLASFLGFINERMLFPGVLHNFKFGLLTMTGYGISVEHIDFAFLCYTAQEAAQEERHFTLTPEEIATINPNTRTAPVFRTKADAELTKKIYGRVPVLVNERTNTSLWGVRFTRMLDMSNDSHLFRNEANEGLLPLYEARMIHQYNHRFASYESVEGRTHMLPEASTEQLKNPSYCVKPCYYVPAEEVEKRLTYHTDKKWFLCYRRITSSALERTMIASIVPWTGINDKLPICLVSPGTIFVVCLLATLNSLCFDFVARQKAGGTQLDYFIVKQLPVLPPDAFSAADIAYIVPRVLELVYTAWDMRPFAADVLGELKMKSEELKKADEHFSFFLSHFSLEHPFTFDEERRAVLRAELDARIARLYGLTRDELRYILDPHDVHGPDFPGETFRVLKEKETRQHGEYRTRRLVLAAWDAQDMR